MFSPRKFESSTQSYDPIYREKTSAVGRKPYYRSQNLVPTITGTNYVAMDRTTMLSLRELKGLLDDGILTDEEFQVQKEETLRLANPVTE